MRIESTTLSLAVVIDFVPATATATVSVPLQVPERQCAPVLAFRSMIVLPESIHSVSLVVVTNLLILDICIFCLHTSFSFFLPQAHNLLLQVFLRCFFRPKYQFAATLAFLPRTLQPVQDLQLQLVAGFVLGIIAATLSVENAVEVLVVIGEEVEGVVVVAPRARAVAGDDMAEYVEERIVGKGAERTVEVVVHRGGLLFVFVCRFRELRADV